MREKLKKGAKKMPFIAVAATHSRRHQLSFARSCNKYLTNLEKELPDSFVVIQYKGHPQIPGHWQGS
ncbi:MAG: hypothetical protein SVR94_14890 [Pseudomonadota bacterium]|nr:hypothetical protein [Pseudomonadota bacterium]